MRILKPEVAKSRKEKILRWVVQQFVETRRPVGSQMIADGALQDVSSATIRNIMKELEEEGYLHQPHTSGGRIPTDKAYRYYVDYLSNVQKMATQEREDIEEQYQSRLNEVDNVVVQASRLLANLSGAAGFVYTSNVKDQVVQRLDLLPVAPGLILAVLVTESGVVRHWPVRVGTMIAPSRLRILGQVINQEISGLTLAQARQVLYQYVRSAHRELADVADLAEQVLQDMQRPQTGADELHVEGIGRLLENTTQDDYEDLKQMMKFVEERERFSSILSEKMTDLQHSDRRLSVSIGSEHAALELKNLSIVTSTYRVGDKTVGMLGIIGPKHMEYTRVISLVNFIGSLLETSMRAWNTLPVKEEN